jgi:Lrp/AsnC family transcriptional regulator, leucine-responsive regulatory protein
MMTELDAIDRKILALLEANARLSFSAIGREVGLSQPAVAERIHRLESEGVISGYHAHLNTEKVGLPIMAFIHLATSGLHGSQRGREAALAIPEVLEIHSVTGDDSFIIKVAVESVKHLETVIQQLGQYGNPSTSLVLSTPLHRRGLIQS